MIVKKRDGRLETVRHEKISKRIHSLCYGLNTNYVKCDEIATEVIKGLHDGVSTVELDHLAAEIAATMITIHPDFGKLAARIEVSNLHKETESSFFNTMKRLYTYINPKTNERAGLISKEVFSIIQQNARRLDEMIDEKKDYSYDYFGFKTLERSYLLRINHKVVERPQHMLLRVALGIHKNDMVRVEETYNLMSEKWFTHATPTLFNSGTPKPQMSSCFLLTMKDDSIDGIYDTLKQCAKISQSAGGIGLSIHNIRAKGSYIKGTGGKSNGIIPMLRNFDMTARYVDQGGGKRNGSFAIYLEPWHADIFDFLELKINHGKEEMRARDLFYALWIPDLFMKRVKQNENWSLFCPNECPGLHETYGENFEALYLKYEKEDKARKKVKAQELFQKIITSQVETGGPYMLFKDAANKKSNQKNLGTIHSSNLCTEIIQYSSKDEVAVCNLASISLKKFVKDDTRYDHQKLYEITKIVTQNLNKIIDENYYPIEEARRSNLRHRPMGIGVQGLADTFMEMKIAFDSPEAKKLNKEIFETIYFAAMETSMEMAQKEGPYETFWGSPLSEGKFQFDLWETKENTESGRWNWSELREKVKKHGVRNSLLLAPMPTASTSQILGNNECFEPYTSNLYTRRVNAGDFIISNKYLMKELIELGLWNEKMKEKLIVNNGSVQNISEIPEDIKKRFKTVWEIPQKVTIDMAADRGLYICQSQSMNVFFESPDLGKMSSMHMYAWEKGLKTGMYYLRTQPARDAIKLNIQKEQIVETNKICSLENKDDCEACGS